MRRVAVVFLSFVLTAGVVPGRDDPAAGYLAVRDQLAPASASSRISLQQILGSGDFGHVELIGDVSGKASCAPSISDEPLHTLMLTLDDGSNVSLRTGEEIDALQVGHRIAVIASTRRVSSSDELTLESWAHQWDLPRESAPEPVQEAPAPQPEPAPPAVEGSVAPPPVVSAGNTTVRLPQPVAGDVTQADAVEVWTRWVLELNSALSEEQARNIVRWVLHYSAEYDVNHKLIFALIKWESWYKPGCVSHAGAIGLMQLMPGTARGLGVNPRNVQQNIQGGTRYLAEQLGKYRDRDNYERVILALACYNAGPNAVARAGHRVPNIRETQSYVKKVSKTFYELHEARMP